MTRRSLPRPPPAHRARRIGDVGMRKNKVEVMVQWYYRPEDAIGGRKGFHGERELFLSDHKDWVAPDSINDKCQVHTLKQYQSLHVVSDVDYFCRRSIAPRACPCTASARCRTTPTASWSSARRARIGFTRRCVLYTGSHTTAFAW
eukprot:30996-Pelagococcus_subviridis.AAC.8